MKKIIITIIICGAVGIIIFPVKSYGSDNGEYGPDSIDYYDFSQIDEVMKDDKFDFSGVVRQFFSGDVDTSLTSIGQSILDALFSELSAQRELIIKVIIIGVIAALLTNIATAFLSGNISETGFYIAFMLLMGTLMAGYVITANLVMEAMDRLLEFMEAVVPVYTLSVGFSTGQASAAAFYEVISIVIVLIQKLLKDFILPMIYIYMIFNFINNIIEGNIFTRICELLKTVIEWMLKALLSCVIGINIIQSMINPVMDTIKTSALGKAASVIPGVGSVLTSVSGLVLSSGTLIKNSIGMASMVAVIVLCFVPVVKVVAISIGYKFAGAVLEPVSDKRIVNSINGIYESMVLLAKTLLYGVVFFLLTMAIICYSTNQNV